MRVDDFLFSPGPFCTLTSHVLESTFSNRHGEGKINGRLIGFSEIHSSKNNALLI